MNQLISDSCVMTFIFSRFPSQDLEMTRNSRRANVQEVEKKISTAEVDESVANCVHVHVHVIVFHVELNASLMMCV